MKEKIIACIIEQWKMIEGCVQRLKRDRAQGQGKIDLKSLNRKKKV